MFLLHAYVCGGDDRTQSIMHVLLSSINIPKLELNLAFRFVCLSFNKIWKFRRSFPCPCPCPFAASTCVFRTLNCIESLSTATDTYGPMLKCPHKGKAFSVSGQPFVSLATNGTKWQRVAIATTIHQIQRGYRNVYVIFGVQSKVRRHPCVDVMGRSFSLFRFNIHQVMDKHAMCLFKLHATMVSGWIAPDTQCGIHYPLTILPHDSPEFVNFPHENGKCLVFAICQSLLLLLMTGVDVDADADLTLFGV